MSDSEHNRKALQEAFDIVDVDGSKEIDMIEFRNLLRSAGDGGLLFNMKPSEAADVFRQVTEEGSLTRAAIRMR